MKTFQDLLKISDNAKGKFCRQAVDEFMQSAEYKQARDGESYYNKHNSTIEHFQKLLYTLTGKQVQDVFSANYKLKTLFFRRLVSQQVQYVLGNGMTLKNMKNKKKLGVNFDFMLQTAAKRAMASGRAFGFWNLDHMEVFGFADTPKDAGFCPLYSEKTAELEAGVRYWFKNVGDDVIFRATLYEADGYTEYSQKNNDEVEILEPKRAYKRTELKDGTGNIEAVMDENYSKLPIVPLYANDSQESELVGIRECIDCYDYIKSGLANDIDDTAGFYWVIKNTGGMDDTDLAMFLQRMKTTKAAMVDGDQGVSAEAHTLDVPHEARSAMLELLRKDIYEDFQSLDVNTLSASAKTTQEIQAAYQSQDNKCADFEYYIIDFCQKILQLAGIDDNPSFVWNRVVNQLEQTQMILQAAQYLTEDMIIKKLPFLTPEEVDEVLKQRDKEGMSMMLDAQMGAEGSQGAENDDVDDFENEE